MRRLLTSVTVWRAVDCVRPNSLFARVLACCLLSASPFALASQYPAHPISSDECSAAWRATFNDIQATAASRFRECDSAHSSGSLRWTRCNKPISAWKDEQYRQNHRLAEQCRAQVSQRRAWEEEQRAMEERNRQRALEQQREQQAMRQRWAEDDRRIRERQRTIITPIPSRQTAPERSQRTPQQQAQALGQAWDMFNRMREQQDAQEESRREREERRAERERERQETEQRLLEAQIARAQEQQSRPPAQSPHTANSRNTAEPSSEMAYQSTSHADLARTNFYETRTRYQNLASTPGGDHANQVISFGTSYLAPLENLAVRGVPSAASGAIGRVFSNPVLGFVSNADLLNVETARNIDNAIQGVHQRNKRLEEIMQQMRQDEGGN